jgi:hypothetical protein
MSSAAEYRKYAYECIAWAKQAKTDSERDLYLRMAKDWLHAATLFDASAKPLPTSDSDATPAAVLL